MLGVNADHCVTLRQVEGIQVDCLLLELQHILDWGCRCCSNHGMHLVLDILPFQIVIWIWCFVSFEQPGQVSADLNASNRWVSVNPLFFAQVISETLDNLDVIWCCKTLVFVPNSWVWIVFLNWLYIEKDWCNVTYNTASSDLCRLFMPKNWYWWSAKSISVGCYISCFVFSRCDPLIHKRSKTVKTNGWASCIRIRPDNDKLQLVCSWPNVNAVSGSRFWPMLVWVRHVRPRTSSISPCNAVVPAYSRLNRIACKDGGVSRASILFLTK